MGRHGHRAHRGVTQVLLHLEGDVDLVLLAARGVAALDGQGVEDSRQLAGLEFNVDHRADDLDDFAFIHTIPQKYRVISRPRRRPPVRRSLW
jgi:hypothetical protein